MGEPTLREDLERQARRFGVDVAVAVSLLPEGRLDDPRAALTVTASELSDIIEPMILALLDRRVPTPKDGWITIAVERALYLDEGREKVLCDRLPSPVTLVLKPAADD